MQIIPCNITLKDDYKILWWLHLYLAEPPRSRSLKGQRITAFKERAKAGVRRVWAHPILWFLIIIFPPPGSAPHLFSAVTRAKTSYPIVILLLPLLCLWVWKAGLKILILQKFHKSNYTDRHLSLIKGTCSNTFHTYLWHFRI